MTEKQISGFEASRRVRGIDQKENNDSGWKEQDYTQDYTKVDRMLEGDRTKKE